MLLSNAVEGYLLHEATRCSEATIKTDRIWLEQLVRFIGDLDVKKVTTDHVTQFLHHEAARGLSAFTVKRQYAVISALYTWLCKPEIRLAELNPTDAIDPPRTPKPKPKTLTREEIESLIDSVSESRNPRRDKALVLFLLDTGAGASELCDLDFDDISFDTGKSLVTGKGSKQRYVYLGKRALSATWLYLKDERPEPAQVRCSRLFLTIDGYPLDRHSLRLVIYRLSERAGFHASPHMFRHTAAITHLRNGMDLVSLQHLLGHADIGTTRQYLNSLRDSDVQKTAQRTSPGDNWRL